MDFDTFNPDQTSDEMEVDFTNTKMVKSKTENDKFRQFLEDNLHGIVTCPMCLCTCSNPVVASDGYIYEITAFNQYVRVTGSWSFKSPLTRTPMTKDVMKVNLVSKFIEFADKYDLEITKNKIIISNSFEDNFEIILELFRNGQYDGIYNYKSFKLDHKDMNTNIFIQIILTTPYTNVNETLKCYQHMFSHAETLKFINTDTKENILHYLFKHCTIFELFPFVVDLLKTQGCDLMEMSNLENNYSNTPIEHAIERNNLKLMEYIITNGFIIKTNLPKIINNCLHLNLAEEYIIKLVMLLEDINAEYNNVSLFYTAIRNNKFAVVKYLKEKGTNLTIIDNQGNNIYMHACKYGNEIMKKYFIELCDNYEYETPIGWRLIDIVCYHCTGSVINQLLDKNVNVTHTIKQFQGKPVEYLPMNLVEINPNLQTEERHQIMDYMDQLFVIQIEFS